MAEIACSESAKIEWACRQIESLLRRVAELEGQVRELNPGLLPAVTSGENNSMIHDLDGCLTRNEEKRMYDKLKAEVERLRAQQVATWNVNGACEVCKLPVGPPTNRYMGPAIVLGSRIWHSHCGDYALLDSGGAAALPCRRQAGWAALATMLALALCSLIQLAIARHHERTADVFVDQFPTKAGDAFLVEDGVIFHLSHKKKPLVPVLNVGEIFETHHIVEGELIGTIGPDAETGWKRFFRIWSERAQFVRHPVTDDRIASDHRDGGDCLAVIPEADYCCSRAEHLSRSDRIFENFKSNLRKYIGPLSSDERRNVIAGGVCACPCGLGAHKRRVSGASSIRQHVLSVGGLSVGRGLGVLRKPDGSGPQPLGKRDETSSDVDQHSGDNDKPPFRPYEKMLVACLLFVGAFELQLSGHDYIDRGRKLMGYSILVIGITLSLVFGWVVFVWAQ